jgi:hypothetical protein
MPTIGMVMLFCALLSVTGAGQEQLPSTRVRITGVRVYNKPGIVEVSPNRVAGSGMITEGSLIHVSLPAASGKLTVLESGKRIVGVTRGVHDGAVILEAEGRTDTIHIPLDAIARLEISKGPASHAKAALAAIGIGFAAFYAGGWLGVAFCGSPIDCPGALLTGVAGGIAGGSLGARIGHEKWKAVPIAWLSDPAIRAKSAAR